MYLGIICEVLVNNIENIQFQRFSDESSIPSSPQKLSMDIVHRPEGSPCITYLPLYTLPFVFVCSCVCPEPEQRCSH